jgi:glyoxylase-like metal-dependent hydrolase (beta-lactamase superfamily II)
MSIIQHLKHGDVEGIRVGRFTFMVSSSVFFYRLGNTLIDCGPPNKWRFVKEFLQEQPVQRVLVTHHHEDHSGNGAAIQNELKIPVFAPPLSLEHLAGGYPLQLYRRVIWGNPSNYRAETLPPVLELENNISLQAGGAGSFSRYELLLDSRTGMVI